MLRLHQPVFLVALLPVLLTVGACSASHRYENVGYTSLRIGISPDYQPIVFRKGLQLAGIEIDLAKEVGVVLEKEIDFVEREWDELIPALQAGKIDVIMSGMSITPEREEKVLFCLPYLQIGQMLLIRQRDATRLHNLGSIDRSKIRLGFETGTTGDQFAEANISHAERRGFSNLKLAIEALRKGEIDALIHDAPTIWHYGFDSERKEFLGIYHPLTKESLAWAVRKEDASLKAQLDAALVTMHRNGRLAKIRNRWIPVRIETK